MQSKQATAYEYLITIFAVISIGAIVALTTYIALQAIL